MGKSRKRQQAKRARNGVAGMEIDGVEKPPADQGVVDMDTSEVAAVKPKALSQNKQSKKAIKKRHAVNVRKKKAAEKALEMSEKKQQRVQNNLAKAVRKNSMKKLY